MKDVSTILREEINKFILNEINVYHASGAPFKHFDRGFMGSGEGSQSFGPGLYFTSSKNIGRDYVKNHSGVKFNFKWKDLPANWTSTKIHQILDGQFRRDFDLTDLVKIESKIDEMLIKFTNVKELCLNIYKLIRNFLKEKDFYDYYDDYIEEYPYREKLNSFYKELLNNLIPNNRYLYNVDIPDEKYFGDWKKPISDEFMKRAKEYIKIRGGDLSLYRFEKTIENYKRNNPNSPITLGIFYQSLDYTFVSRDDSDVIFINLMRAFGYKGVRYPAGQNFSTEHTKNGDINYTVFNGNDARIKKRWDY